MVPLSTSPSSTVAGRILELIDCVRLKTGRVKELLQGGYWTPTPKPLSVSFHGPRRHADQLRLDVKGSPDGLVCPLGAHRKC